MEKQDQQKLDRIKASGFWTFFIEKKVITALLIIAAVSSGLFSYMTMPREIQPEINLYYVGVSSYLPGANSTDTESLITEPLEKEVGTVSGIKTMSSTSSGGASVIFLEFETSVDFAEAVQSVKDAVDRVKGELPEDAIDPMVAKFESNEFSIITYSLVGNLPVSELTKIAEETSKELEKVSGVSSANLIGSQDEQVQVILDPQKLETYGLDIQTITTLIKLSNTNMPLGVIPMDELSYSIRIDNRYQNMEDLRNLPLITFPDGTPLLLKDVATVKKGYPEQPVLTRISLNGEKALPAVSLQIFKKEGGNILAIVDKTKEKIDELKANGAIPEAVKVAVTNDNSDFIRQDLGVLTTSGYETTLLIIIVIFLALGFRQGLIAGISVPLTFLITFTIMDVMGLTINSLSMFALVIALGIAVDVSIVIMQGIHKNTKNGIPLKDAVLLAVETYKWPLIAGAMTTVFAFFPMLLVSGIMGEFLKTLPIVITTALLTALFLGLTVTPSLASKFLKQEKILKTYFPLERILSKIGKGFYVFIGAVVEKKIVRIISLWSVIGLFFLALAMPMTGLLKVEMFPQTNQNYFIVNIEAPKGVLVEKTSEIVEEVEKEVYKIPEVSNFVSIIGSNQSVALSGDELIGSGGSESSNLATVTVNLVNKDEREAKSYEIAEALNQKFKNFTDAKVSVDQISEGPPSDAPVNVKVLGKDLDELKKISAELMRIIEGIPGTDNVKTSLTAGLNEFKYYLDRDKLAIHGLSSIQVAAAIRNILQGAKATTINMEGEDLDVVVKYDLPKKRNRTNLTFHDIENFEIQTPKGYKVSLSELGKYDFGTSPDTITREEQKRVIKISSELLGDANAVEVNQQIQAEIDKMQLPSGYEIKFGGDFEQIAESFRDLFRSMIVGLILIAACLVLEFNSFRQTFMILLTLPMGLIGVFPGLYLMGLNLSFPAFLGIVALAGIVVNHAIVLFDRINESRRAGMGFAKSIAEATYSRFEPIFITTLTAIVGTIPLALTNEFWAGLGFALIWGLAFSTLLTLVTLPIIYYTFELRGARKNGEL
ncbi:MAG: efflux RND transporter permease subunit [Candidatus Gracilibacteria bacterium]|jgi:multidrug efflux pump subunit AcrB